MKTTLTFLLVLLLSGPAVAQDLPTYMRADKYLLEATRAMEGDDRQEALRGVREIRGHGCRADPSFAYLYARRWSNMEPERKPGARVSRCSPSS